MCQEAVQVVSLKKEMTQRSVAQSVPGKDEGRNDDVWKSPHELTCIMNIRSHAEKTNGADTDMLKL
jgi:hypothetical protein